MPKPYILILIFFVLTHNRSTAQGVSDAYKTFMTGDTSALHLIKQSVANDSIFSNVLSAVKMDKIQDDINNAFQKSEAAGLLKQFNGIVKRKNVFNNIYRSTTVNMNYYYTSDDTLTVNNNFFNANVNTNFNFMGIPVTGQFSAVFVNNVWQSQWSSGGLNIDLAQYKQNIFEKLSMEHMKKHFSLNIPTGDFHLPNTDYSVLLNDAKYTAYTAVINNPKFSELKYAVTQKLDSIRAQKDSSLHITATKDSLTRVYNSLMAFEQKYEKIWSERSNYINQANELRTKFKKVEGDLTKLQDPEFIKGVVARSKILSWKEKMLHNMRDFSFGRFSTDEDEFTIKNQLLAGFKFETEINHKTFGVIYGTGAYAAFNSPVFYNPFQQAALGKRFIQLKYGFTTPDSGKIVFRFMNAHRTSDTSFNTFYNSPDNSVLDATYSKDFGKRFGIVTAIAYSHLGENIGFSDETSTNPTFINRVATSGTLYYAVSKSSKIGLGYYYIGSDFATFGNDFLVNNRNGVKLDGKIGLFKNKLSLKGEVRYGKPNNANLSGLSESALTQISTEASWNMGKGNFVQFRYMPNNFTQNTARGDNRVDYRSNIYLLTGSFNYKAVGLKQYTNITFSNINQQAQFFDSLKINQTSYLGLNQRLVLNTQNSVDFKSQFGYTAETHQISSGYVQLNDNFSVGKNYKFTSGLQASKRVGEQAWRMGITANSSLNLGRFLHLNTGIIYRLKPLNETTQDSKPEWLLNTSATLMF